MVGSSLDEELDMLQSRVRPLEQLVGAFAATLGPPLKYHSGQVHYGFRYAKPDERHFCLLKCSRAVSALNASIVLARHGYPQEIAVLIRTLIECTTHVKYVLNGRQSDGELTAEMKKYVQGYFSDFARNTASDFKRTDLRQGAVHNAIGKDLEKFALDGVDPSKLLSNVYLTYSNYVHAKYPEAMDLYGGIPGRFHVCGMSGTPKDNENVLAIEAFIDDVSNTLKLLILQLNLKPLLSENRALREWYNGR